MTISTRAYTPDMLNPVIDLLLDYRGAGYVHTYPTVWRLRQLIDSRLWDASLDTRLWEDSSGKLCAFGLLWRRSADSPYFGLERIIHPDHASLSGDILNWAAERARQAGASAGALPLEMNPEQDIALLESKGFARYPGFYNISFAMALPDAPGTLTLPDGYTLASLQASDLEQYQAVYDFTAVNIAYQRALLREPEYHHFVVKTPDGELAAFLECSFSRAEWERSGQRIGWIDYIQTQPAYQKRGIAEALLRRSFAHLRSNGAETVMLLTAASNVAAQSLFKKAGMTVSAEESPYTVNG